MELQFIPARGRKRACVCFRCRKPYYNLSPQGDGNLIDAVHGTNIHITIYPRKGTETTDVITAVQKATEITIYPRKGTETPSSE